MDDEQFRILEKRLHDLQDDSETNKELQALDKIALLGAGGGTIASATVLSGLLARAPQSVLPWPMVADFTIFVLALGLSFWVQTLKVRLARTAHVHRRQDAASKQPEVVSKRKRAVQLAIASYEKRVKVLGASPCVQRGGHPGWSWLFVVSRFLCVSSVDRASGWTPRSLLATSAAAVGA